MLLLSRFGVKAFGALGAGFVLTVGLVLADAAQAEPRVALVIGNSAYQGDLPALPNPANDAKLMAKTLKTVGFDVVEAEDADQDGMKKAIAAFSEKLTAAGSDGTGLFFYAGHGVQVAGENYLVPIDAKLKREADVTLQAVAASTVLQQMVFANSAVNIIILDACRNNPLGDGARGLSRGLAEIKTTPRGSFLAYSTAPGSTAADGDGTNSPYTVALAQTITEPGLSISDVFQEVRTKVLASTGNQQTPWDSSSLTGRFYFTAPPTTTAGATSAEPSAADEALKTEKTYWDSVKDSGDPDSIQLYLAKYPNGYFVDLANAKLDELKGGTKVASADSANKSAIPVAQPDNANRLVQPDATAFIAQNQTVYARGGGQVRAQPNGAADLMAKLPTNTEVTATGVSTDGKWWRVAMADGRTGYMHKSVVAEQAAQLASAAPAAPAANPPAQQMRTLDTDTTAFQTMGGPAPAPAPAPQQGNEVAQQLLTAGLQQLGLPGINIPKQQAAPQPQTVSFSLQPMNGVVQVKAGAQIFAQPGGQQIYTLKKAGSMLASARTSDGRWYEVALPNAQVGYISRQWVGK